MKNRDVEVLSGVLDSEVNVYTRWCLGGVVGITQEVKSTDTS